jgi:hypothetical protein
MSCIGVVDTLVVSPFDNRGLLAVQYCASGTALVCACTLTEKGGTVMDVVALSQGKTAILVNTSGEKSGVA